MATKTKATMFCPWCEEGQARTWQGMTAHVRAKHNDKIGELKDNKEHYLKLYACDEFGNPLGGSPELEPKSDPTPAPKQEPEPKTPAPVVKPPEPKTDPEPELKPKPAEGGGFRGSIRRGIFGD